MALSRRTLTLTLTVTLLVLQAGLFFIALFVLVKKMFYTQSCQSAVFYMAAALVVQQVYSWNHIRSS